MDTKSSGIDPVLESATSSPPDPLPLLLANPSLLSEDLTRRSDSPVANSPSKSTGTRPAGSASVSSPLRDASALPGQRPPGAAVSQQDQQQNQGSGYSEVLTGGARAEAHMLRRYTFPSPPPDTSDLRSELEEFYSYVEVPQVLDHKDSFSTAWPHPTPFAETSKELQLSHIRSLLEGLSSSDPDVRFTNARHILYIAQGNPKTLEAEDWRSQLNLGAITGTFESSTSPDHHLHLVLSNVALLRSANALPLVWEAVKGTGLRWEGVSTISDPDVPSPPGGFSAQERQDYLDEINGELAIHLAILYFMVEVYRGDDEWAEELMALEPPMPIYLFQLVAGLREKNAKGYPVKKLLLLLWKSILSCIGGMKDVARVKEFVREVEGLPPDGKNRKTENRPDTKVAPTDYQSFRNEITSKYPSYQAPPISSVDLDRISAAAAPIPIRPSFSYHINPNHESSGSSSDGLGQQPPVAGGTPAPTPPTSPAPKPKKQQFQTDQTRPFVLPFSPANAGPKDRPPRAVPQSIDEASELYRRNMRISTELWQTWKLREELMADESGILKAEAAAAAAARATVGQNQEKRTGGRAEAAKISRRMEALSLSDDEDDGSTEDSMDPLSMLRALEKKLRAEEGAEEDSKKKKVITQRRGDVQRLERIEVLYRSILPQLQSAVIVLLKLLLATVTANTNQNGGGAPDSGNDEVVELNLEDTDILRHREITSKAVSAILILSLKWFKTSHVMKFHYLSQLLVDSNCLLLILKMFGLQEVSTSVKTKNDRADYSFFKFCHDKINPSSELEPRPEDAMLVAKPAGAHPAGQNDGTDDDEVELITDFSWRNFFAVINFVHILQKLTKRKTHRVLLLVQYKSSAILKRILKVSHPTLQLYVLKVIKSQVPYCGRKWRQSNMKVITAIYLHCRPDLRDEWLTGVDVDGDVEESLPHEQALRALVRFFNTKHYGAYAPLLHRRSSSANHPPPEFGQIPPSSPGGRPSSENDTFPPMRSVSSYDSDLSFRAAFGQEALDDVGDYEVDDLLSPGRDDDLFGDGDLESTTSRAAWDRLGDLMGNYDDISDSESVGSFNFLGFRDDESSDGSVSDLDIDEEVSKDQIRQEWEAISPETITALEEERNAGSPRSPRPRGRRASTGPISPALRPVVIDRDDETVDDEVENVGPAQTQPHTGPPVDEVEFGMSSLERLEKVQC
ncbi:hypothetical protein P7C70_g2979, partial [Phenoliferia sp. Uapishka_3]